MDSLLIIFWSIGFLLYVFFSGGIADSAQKKGRSWAAFFWLSLLVSPILMGIITASIKLPEDKAKSLRSIATSGEASSGFDSIEKLGGLLEKGLISQEEFDKKKAEFLDKL